MLYLFSIQVEEEEEENYTVKKWYILESTNVYFKGTLRRVRSNEK